MKNKIFISRLEYLENGIDLSRYGKIKKIVIIDPSHEEFYMMHCDIYLECKQKDLICLVIYED